MITIAERHTATTLLALAGYPPSQDELCAAPLIVNMNVRELIYGGQPVTVTVASMGLGRFMLDFPLGEVDQDLWVDPLGWTLLDRKRCLKAISLQMPCLFI